MDKTKSPPKTNMSFPSIKYKVNQDEIEEIYSPTDAEKSVNLDTSESTDKSKKSDKAGPSILDKYLKAFKVDKNTEEELKHDSAKDISDKRNSEISEVSGSPIKEYFSKFHKRTDSVENSTNDTETAKDLKDKDTSERWKLFSEIKVKFAQAVEDIKSARTNEEVKEKQSSVEDISDSEDNSIHQELDPSMASTENQVSSISSSSHNLSDLSLALSHSSTITDSEMDTNSSNENNPLNVTPTADKKESSHNKHISEDKPTETKEQETFDEIESGVDALEDFELSTNVPTTENNEINVTIAKNILKSKNSQVSLGTTNQFRFISYRFIFSTVFVFIVMYILPTFIMLNGVFIGLWLSSCLKMMYLGVLNYFGCDQETASLNRSYGNIPISKIPQIVEFEPLKKYEGWVNIFSYKKYDPVLYHVSLTNTVHMKLEGSILRLSYTYTKIPKRAMFDEKEYNASFYEHKIYDLDGAQIMLLPVGIIRKRHWSKKYPICIKINKSKATFVTHIENVDHKNNKDSHTDSSGSAKTPSSCRDSKTAEDRADKSPEKLLCSTGSDANKPDTPRKPSSHKAGDVSKNVRRSKTKIKKFHSNDFLDDDDSDEDDSMFRDAPNADFYDVVNNDLPIAKDDQDFLNVTDLPSSDNKTDANETDSINLYLFCRTGREKSEWFKRLKNAIDECKSQKHLPDHCDSDSVDVKSDSNDHNPSETADNDLTESRARLGTVKGDRKTQDFGETSVLWTPSGSLPTESLLSESFVPTQDVDFWKHMKNIIENKYASLHNPKTPENENNDYLWLNALLGRVAFDTFRNPTWVLHLQERIQKKLSSIKLPSFMGPLIVSNLELGYETPFVLNASAPTLDACGVWVDLHVSYSGKATMTLTTQLNLMSLKERRDTVSSEDSQEEQKVHHKDVPSHKKKFNMAVFDSDLEDTAESSSDDEAYNISTSQFVPEENVDVPQLNVGNTPAKKLLRIVDKIAASKFFEHVTEYKYVKRAMEGVSKTDLKLNVELCELVGCFTINIPPPPSDRLWFGFRGSPHMVIKAKPILGSRVINFGQVTGWIERRLMREFEKILVYPNLEDIIIDTLVPPPL